MQSRLVEFKTALKSEIGVLEVLQILKVTKIVLIKKTYLFAILLMQFIIYFVLCVFCSNDVILLPIVSILVHTKTLVLICSKHQMYWYDECFI